MNVILDEAIEFLPDQNQVRCKDTTLIYDYLIVACGANHSYFGHPEWEQFAPGLKTIEQATEIRRRILAAFEEAEKEKEKEKQKAWMNFIIVGGGPTGVEMAGAIAELANRTIRGQFRNIDPTLAKIILIEAGPKVLGSFDDKLSERAAADLKHLGVEVRVSTRVTSLSAEGVQTDKEFIPCKTAIWAAGVAPSVTGKKFNSAKPVELDPGGRVKIQNDLTLAAYSNIYVIGDQASLLGVNGKPLPGLAPVAMQQGRHAARNILRAISKKPLEDFSYLDKGSLATIGRRKAVLQFGKIRLAGQLAWFAWLFIHIFYLIGFRNRLIVFMDWTWNYFTFSRGARLIVDKDWHLKG